MVRIVYMFIVLLLLTTRTEVEATNIDSLYSDSPISRHINYDIFKQVTERYAQESKNKELLTLIDFSLPSTRKRLFVLDMQRGELLYHTHVSHGKNSGENYATKFSNREGSHQSSLGYYRTLNTYTGRNGYSLRLEGLDKGVNDNAYKRAIVIHGAEYAKPKNISHYGGRLGRSFGCPALPTDIAKEIIDTIKDGSILFIFAE